MLLLFMLFSRNPKLKLTGILSILFGLLGAVALSDKIIHYLGRGQGTNNIATLSERTIVWHISAQAFWHRPLLGYGYIAGPKHAIYESWVYKHWVPPHAHSDFLQAFLSGGILAGILIVVIYAGGLWVAFRRTREGPGQVFLFLALIQISITSIIEVLLTTQFTDLGGVFLLAYIGVVATPKTVTLARRAFATSLPMKLRYQ
jgi:O-antigen ligase